MTVMLKDILDPAELETLVFEGFVRIQTHPDEPSLHILNYTPKAVSHEWTPTLRACRGLIYADPGIVVARGINKFFNSTEPETTAWLPGLPGDTPCRAYDKLDGSLGIIYRAPDGMPAVATRGSFASEQAIHATALLRASGDHLEWCEDWVAGGTWDSYPFTPVVEIIYPENRIVLDYQGLDDLVLIGVVDHKTGVLHTPVSVDEGWGWPGGVAERLEGATLAECLALGDRYGKEGMVLHVLQADGKTFKLAKVKQADYVALHRIVTSLSERAVWEVLTDTDGSYSDENWAPFLEQLPAEHQDWAEGIQNDLEGDFDAMYEHAIDTTESVIGFHGTDAKAFALAVADEPDKHLLFLAFRKQDDRLKAAIWKALKPKGNTPPWAAKEEA